VSRKTNETSLAEQNYRCIHAVWISSCTEVQLPEQVANVIYIGGDIITINDSQPNAEGVAIKDGKILDIGTKANVQKYKGRTTKIVDLNGKTLLPGFIDAHGHVFNTGLQALAANLLSRPRMVP
jgi:predicted amidohydrolase YtcJ